MGVRVGVRAYAQIDISQGAPKRIEPVSPVNGRFPPSMIFLL